MNDIYIPSSTAVITTCEHITENRYFVAYDDNGMRKSVCAKCLAPYLQQTKIDTEEIYVKGRKHRLQNK